MQNVFRDWKNNKKRRRVRVGFVVEEVGSQIQSARLLSSTCRSLFCVRRPHDDKTGQLDLVKVTDRRHLSQGLEVDSHTLRHKLYFTNDHVRM